MGKMLIINGSDFGESAVGTVAMNGAIKPLIVSVYGWMFHKSTNSTYDWGIRYNTIYTTTHKRKLYIFDVSMYIGESITITRDIAPISTGGYSSAFLSDLPSDFELGDLKSQATSSGIVDYTVSEAVSLLTETSKQIGYVQTINVPEGCKYLLVTAPYTGGTSESDGWSNIATVGV